MPLRPLPLLLLALGLLAACGRESPAEPAAPPPPDPALAANPDYKTPPHYKTECFGRHLIDVPGEMEWAMADPEKPYYSSARFTEKIYAMSDLRYYERVEVSATPKTQYLAFQRARGRTELEDERFVERLKEKIEIQKGRIDDFQRYLLDDAEVQRWRRYQKFDAHHPMPGASEAEITEAVRQDIRRAIRDIEHDIKELEEAIAEFREVDLKLPDAYARTRGSNIVAYLWRDNRVWRFATRKAEGETFEYMLQGFLDTLRRFRPRALYEIPTEPGVCVPYGFFADDGHSWYQLQNSLRLKDAPNVLYTLGLGKNLEEPKATGYDVWASSFMLGSGIGGMILDRQITNRIKPRQIRIGAMQGILGGFVIKPDLQKGNDQEQSYHLQAGYDGEANSDAFPFVTFQVRSFTQGADPTLKKPAPPFEASEARALGILNSLRLRPTR